jgi:hypothetical protein
MFILGAGLGMVMQILITAVQNAVNMSEVGAATAGANFFRSIGGSFGTAIFGAFFSNELPIKLRNGMRGIHYSGAIPSFSRLTPAQFRHLPLEVMNVFVHALSRSISDVYLWAIPVGALAFVLSLTLPEVKLRSSVHHVADEIPLSNAEPGI